MGAHSAGDGRRPVTVRVASWSARNPWYAVVGWVVFVALCVGMGAVTGTNKGTVEDFWIGEAGRAEAIAAVGGLTPAPVEQVLITAPSGALDHGAAAAAAQDVRARMAAVPEVAGVGVPATSADGSAVRVPVTLAGDTTAAKRSIGRVQEQTAAVQAAHPGVVVAQTGGASMGAGVDASLGRDLGRVEMISLPVTFVILFVVFGAVLAAGIPVLLALSAFLGSVGLYGLASWLFPDAGGATVSVVFLLGMAVGVDYSLFYLKRVREERARTGGTLAAAAAVELAAVTAGRAIVTSGVAVVVSLAGLYIVDDVIFSSIATGAILVVSMAVASSLTVLPALLVLIGHRVDGRHLGRFLGRKPDGGGLWAALLRPAMRRPVATLVAGVAVTGALAWPATTMVLGTEGRETFPTSVPAVATYHRLLAAFPDAGISHIVAVRNDPARAGEVATALDALAARTDADPGFAPDATVRTSADGTTSTFQVAVPYPENSPDAEGSLDRLRTFVPAVLAGPGVEYAVTGDVAHDVDYAAHQEERIPWVIGAVSLATLLVMMVAFRSPVLAAVGVAINLAAVAVACGVLTLVFQGSWAEELLGFHSTGFIGSRMPLMIFAVLVGLSTDYQIFVVSRIREAVVRGVPTRQAVRDGIATSAGVVTSAALIMVSVFVAFMLIDRIELKQVGVGLTVAVLFDAVVLRILILPSVMAVLGERCWWPHRPTPAPGYPVAREPRSHSAVA